MRTTMQILIKTALVVLLAAACAWTPGCADPDDFVVTEEGDGITRYDPPGYACSTDGQCEDRYHTGSTCCAPDGVCVIGERMDGACYARLTGDTTNLPDQLCGPEADDFGACETAADCGIGICCATEVGVCVAGVDYDGFCHAATGPALAQPLCDP